MKRLEHLLFMGLVDQTGSVLKEIVITVVRIHNVIFLSARSVAQFF